MFVIEIEDIKRFMGKLLIENAFDSLSLVQAEIKMAVTYEIDGRINKAFLNSDEEEESGEFIAWSDIKPQVMNLIKGKKLPVKMKLMLENPEKQDVTYSLNVIYENARLRLITNVTQKTFSLERPDVSGWEEYIKGILKDNQIAYTIVC